MEGENALMDKLSSISSLSFINFIYTIGLLLLLSLWLFTKRVCTLQDPILILV